MTGYQELGTLIHHELSYYRRERESEQHLGRRRWSLSVPGLVIWFAVITWQGPNIRFNLNYSWYATLALPLIAMGVATGHIVNERKNGTVGWWLSLPMPRYLLVLSKWVASILLTAQRSFYLAGIALLGVYAMMLNGTASPIIVGHFLLNGLTWTLIMYCLVPPLAALGLFMGTLTYSRWKDLIPGVWLVLVATGWLPVAHPGLYLTVNQALTVTIKPAFGLAVFATWLLSGFLFWLATRILTRVTGL